MRDQEHSWLLSFTCSFCLLLIEGWKSLLDFFQTQHGYGLHQQFVARNQEVWKSKLNKTKQKKYFMYWHCSEVKMWGCYFQAHGHGESPDPRPPPPPPPPPPPCSDVLFCIFWNPDVFAFCCTHAHTHTHTHTSTHTNMYTPVLVLLIQILSEGHNDPLYEILRVKQPKLGVTTLK